MNPTKSGLPPRHAGPIDLESCRARSCSWIRDRSGLARSGPGSIGLALSSLHRPENRGLLVADWKATETARGVNHSERLLW